MEYYFNLTIYNMGNYSKTEKREKFLYESPGQVLMEIPVPYVLCMSGENEDYNYSDNPNWFESN